MYSIASFKILGCHHLSELKNLTSLNLSQNERITNIGASSLATLENLKALNLSNTNTTSEVLPFYKSLVHLQSLAMYGCKGIHNSTQMQDLQRHLPNLKCMRLSVSSDGDGTIDEGESEESDGIDENNSIVDDDDDDDDDGVSFSDESSDRESNISFIDEEDDENNDDDDDETMNNDT